MSTKNNNACRQIRHVSRNPTPCFIGFRMRWFTVSLLLFGLVTPALAHHPDREHHRIWPRIDVIPPLGVNLPMGYRRQYNRPTYLGGWIAYKIAPSSQEAMAWHDAVHQRAYQDHRGRLEKHYFYRKPWEGLRIGPREDTTVDRQNGQVDRQGPMTSDALREAVKAEDAVLSASDDPTPGELREQAAELREEVEASEPVAEPPAPLPPTSDGVEPLPADQP